ncbi:MAG: hypothetical protein IPN69_18665 [Acidobacteria bacterium]|nr:hypothetical protein [Acidobacteriota bacterium]
MFRTFIASLIGTVILTVLPLVNYSQECRTPDTTKRVTLFLSNRSLDDALSTLGTKAGVSIGFVDLSTVRNPSRLVSLKLVCVSIEDALAEIFSQDRRYQWEIKGDIVNVWPRDSDVTVNRIANVRIRHLEFREVPLSEVGIRILESGDVKSQLSIAEKTGSGGMKYSGPARDDPKIVASFKNEALRDVLNKFLLEGNAAFWKIELDGAEDQFVQIVLLGVVSD